MSVRKRRSAPRWPALAIVLFATVCALAIAAYREAGDPRFALDSLTVRGETRTSAQAIELAAALTKGSNVWLLDTGGAEQRVEALPWIATAHIARAWPNHVTVDVTERTPVARVALPDDVTAEEPTPVAALIDAAFRVLAVAPQNYASADLPLFRIEPQPRHLQPGADATGTDVERAYDALVQLRALGLRVSEVDLKPSTGVAVTCDGGLHVLLGSDDDLAKKVSLFKAILPKIASPEDVVYVDLRSVRAPTVLYR